MAFPSYPHVSIHARDNDANTAPDAMWATDYVAERSDTCVAGMMDILDKYCENLNIGCYTCRRAKKCHLAVKLAHDALVGKLGLNDDIDHTKWNQLVSWRTKDAKLRGF